MRFMALLFLLLSSTVNAETTYIYKATDGTVWFGDKMAQARIGDVDMIGIYGRAPAVETCGGSKQEIALKESNYLYDIKKAAKKYKVDYRLVKAIIKTESCFNPKAVSRVGAQGLMQLMPKTATSLGVTKSFNATQNIMGGTKYIKRLLNRFNQNTQHALAAYNAGPTAVVKYKGIPPYKETQKYVKKVMAAYSLYNESL